MKSAWVWADRLTLVALAVGGGLLFQPWWRGGLRWGFAVVLVATIAQIVTAHVVARKSGR